MSSAPPAPAAPPKSWTLSNTIRYMVATWLSITGTHVLTMFAQHAFDWWVLGADLVGAVIAVGVRMNQGDIEAPFAVLNARNPKP